MQRIRHKDWSMTVRALLAWFAHVSGESITDESFDGFESEFTGEVRACATAPARILQFQPSFLAHYGLLLTEFINNLDANFSGAWWTTSNVDIPLFFVTG